ncbi:MAG: PilZ domain-containing protein [Candidatus Omnitrophota bacterium]|nr:MAG: PilZ domain-containing protein [Candidatus Omnitrophota bacterium]
MTSAADRRKYPRLPTTYIVRYKPRYSKTNYEVTQTKNISLGGIFLLTPKMLKQGQQLEMHIQFPFARKKIMVLARVISCEKLARGEIYETRLKFIEMSEETKQKLAEIIQRRKWVEELE